MGINAQGIYEWDGTETFPEWRDDLTASITATVADINSDIAAIAVPADSGWVNLTTFSTGWSAQPGYTPRIRRVGSRVDMEGLLARATTTGLITSLLTIPVGYRPPVPRFVAATITSSGKGLTLQVANTGVLALPTGYVTAAIASGDIVPLYGTWYVN